MNVKELSEQYLELFKRKDVESLRGMFSKTVTLRDWNCDESGIDNVMAVFGEIYDIAKTIEVKKNKSMIESVITINGKQIFVVDLLEFDDDGLLKDIRAYKGN